MIPHPGHEARRITSDLETMNLQAGQTVLCSITNTLLDGDMIDAVAPQALRLMTDALALLDQAESSSAAACFLQTAIDTLREEAPDLWKTGATESV